MPEKSRKTSPQLSTWLSTRSLISIRRSKIDGYGIQGFLVGLSEELLALEYVYDFQIDGLMILRRSDSSDIKRTGTDEFQEQLLKREGIRPGTQTPILLDLDGWRSTVQQLSEHYPLMILERELGPSPEVFIGRPIGATPTQVEFQTFTGVGRWSKKAEQLKFKQITSLQVNNRYLGFYQRHFERPSA